jgi:hypothetical protein
MLKINNNKKKKYIARQVVVDRPDDGCTAEGFINLNTYCCARLYFSVSLVITHKGMDLVKIVDISWEQPKRH